MNQCSQPSWSKLNTAAMLRDVFSMTKTHYVQLLKLSVIIKCAKLVNLIIASRSLLIELITRDIDDF